LAGELVQVDAPGSGPGVPAIYRAVENGSRLFQGELVERLIEFIPKYRASAPDEVEELAPRVRPLAVVVSQDCDLEQDWSRRQKDVRGESDLPCVLLCPALPAEQLRETQKLASDLWKPIRSNKNERYQYLAEVPAQRDQASEGHVALLVDFRSVFTLGTVEIYRQLRSTATEAPRRRFRLETPWAEHLQARYAYYVSRIALPLDHFIPESRKA
jgi:hypothetical protein